MSSRVSSRVALVLALALATSRVAAQNDADLDRAKASFKAGAAAYGAGDYAAAIEALGLAYELTPLPAIAFSLAQAERRQYFVNHTRAHLEHAIRLFRRYVEQVPSAGRRSDALDALSQLEPLLAQETELPEAGVQRDQARRTRIMVSTVPADARVTLDHGEPASAPLILEVQPGRHSVKVEAAGYTPNERETMAVAGELILTEVELHALPSRLLLTTASNAEIYLDGHFVRRGGARVELSLSSGAHELRVAQAGRRPFEQTLLLTPGQQLNVTSELLLTRQRKGARALFVVSGTLFAASAALLGVALASEQRAQDFLDRRERNNVSSSELARYRDDLQRRDRLRTPAILTGTLAVGSLLAALLLHLLDTVDAYEGVRASELPDKASVARLRLLSAGLLGQGAVLHVEL